MSTFPLSKIPSHSIVRLPDGRVGRLVKDRRPAMVITYPAGVSTGVPVQRETQLEVLLFPAQLAVRYLQKEVCDECCGAGRIPNFAGTGDDAGGWADHCSGCGGSGNPPATPP